MEKDGWRREWASKNPTLFNYDCVKPEFMARDLHCQPPDPLLSLDQFIVLYKKKCLILRDHTQHRQIDVRLAWRSLVCPACINCSHHAQCPLAAACIQISCDGRTGHLRNDIESGCILRNPPLYDGLSRNLFLCQINLVNILIFYFCENSYSSVPRYHTSFFL